MKVANITVTTLMLGGLFLSGVTHGAAGWMRMGAFEKAYVCGVDLIAVSQDQRTLGWGDAVKDNVTTIAKDETMYLTEFKVGSTIREEKTSVEREPSDPKGKAKTQFNFNSSWSAEKTSDGFKLRTVLEDTERPGNMAAAINPERWVAAALLRRTDTVRHELDTRNLSLMTKITAEGPVLEDSPVIRETQSRCRVIEIGSDRQFAGEEANISDKGH